MRRGRVGGGSCIAPAFSSRNSSWQRVSPPTATKLTTTTTTVSLRRFKSTKVNPNNNNNNSSALSSYSLLNSAAEYYASLRWRFATSLTESLSKDQQEELLERLNITPKYQEQQQGETTTKEGDQEEMQNSIAEAVAAARAEEAQSQRARWEKEKSKLMAEAEEAAKARVENELLIQHRRMAFEKWQQEVQRDDEKQRQSSSPTTTTTSSGRSEDVDNAEGAVHIPPQEQEPFSTNDHPVLGSALTDLGYKRIHIASLSALKSLPVWNKQRTYRHLRAKSMAQDKLKTLHLGMPGVIALHEDSNGKLSIIDGQHRVGMMTILEEKKQNAKDGPAFFDLDKILVEVYPDIEATESSSRAQDIFLEINKAEPVKLVDLPGINLTKTDRKTINEGAKRLEEAFPAMFSASQRCRAPHLNIDNLRDALFASDVVKRHGLKSPKALETWMMEQNENLKKEYTSSSPSELSKKKVSSVSKTALEKAIDNDFYLGLDSSWLYA